MGFKGLIMNVENSIIVAKFGGSSMSEAKRVENNLSIILSNSDRRFIVVSAPGKRPGYEKDTKITDLLINAGILGSIGLPFDQQFDQVAERFSTMGRELQCYSIFNWLNDVYRGIGSGFGRDWAASRGEYLNARLMAELSGFTFIDAQELILIKENGQVDPKSYDLIRERFANSEDRYIISGYYGLDKFGKIKTFSRGGSDISGAIIARGVNARLYENWTDVKGLLAANPNLWKYDPRPGVPRTVDMVTYLEQREMSNGGAEVLHSDAILPVYEVNIPTNIKSTLDPDHPGTMIVANRPYIEGEGAIGITGHGGFAAVKVRKPGMNGEVGIGDKILQVFSGEGISYEQAPSGKDHMAIVVDQKKLEEKEPEIMRKLSSIIQPNDISIRRNFGLIYIVGQNIQDDALAGHVNNLLSSALAEAHIAARPIASPPSDMTIVISVDDENVNKAIKVLYDVLIDSRLCGNDVT